MTHAERLRSLGLTLPPVATPVGSYLPALKWGDLVYTSGQLPVRDGELTCTGKVSSDVSIERAAQAARVAALNGIAAIAAVAGGPR